MKAVPKKVDKFVEKPVENSSDFPMQFDGLIVVMFPEDTWNKVLEIGKEVGLSASEVISVAIERMSDEIEEKKHGA